MFRQDSGREDHSAAEAGLGRQAARQATDERVHGVGQRRAAQDLEGLSRYAQLQHL